MAIDYLTPTNTINAQVSAWVLANLTYSGDQPIWWENVDFAPELNDSNPLFVIPRVLPISNDKIEVGYGGAINMGAALSCQIIGRSNKFVSEVVTAANSFLNYFSNKVFDTVHFENGRIVSLETIQQRFQATLQIPFNVHQTQ